MELANEVTAVDSPASVDVEAVQRRTVGVLSTVQVFSGMAVAGSIPAGALIAASLGGEQVAGLAQTCGVLGAAIVALPLAIGFGITSGLSATAGIDLIWGIISGVATYFVLKWTHRLGR